MDRTSKGLEIVSVSIALGAASASAQVTSQLKETLRQTYTGVMFHEVGVSGGAPGETRVTAVFGVPMSRGNTPREAAEAWLALYGSIFDDGATFGSPDLRDFAEFKLRNGRTVFAYKQRVDGLEVEGSMGRIMVYDGPPAQVVYVSANVAERPEGGLPAPRVSGAEAMAAARRHPVGTRLSQWGEPEMVAMIDPTRGREAMPVWKVVGEGVRESYTFRVDAVTGEVVDYFSNTSHAFSTDEISGNVSAWVLDGVEPLSFDDGCLNSVSLRSFPDVLVEAIDPDTQQVLDSTFADLNGDYVLTLPPSAPSQVDVRVSFTGPGWVTVSAEGTTLHIPGVFPCPTRLIDSQMASASVPSQGVDFEFNSAPTPVEFRTATASANIALSQSWRYFADRLGDNQRPMPGLDETVEVQVNIDKRSSSGCGASYLRTGLGLCNGDEPAFVVPSVQGTCVRNLGFSTVVAHEYGHYLGDFMMGIVPASAKAFHEGYADSVTIMVFDTHVLGLNYLGCGTLIRAPLSDNPTYPWCNSDPHATGELLGALWIDLKNSLVTLEVARQLHVDWSLIAQPPVTGCTGGASADQTTLIEILTADDDDGVLANGTPHCATILSVFEDRNIFPFVEIVCGGDSVRSAMCYPDCDTSSGSGILDVFDFLCFQSRFVAGDAYACDCDTSTGERVCDILDFLCFQDAFVLGCAANRWGT